VHAYEVLPAFDHRPGKGEVLWKSLAVSTGDVVVFLDSDLYDFSSSFVVGLLGPLLIDPSVSFIKAVYDRPLSTSAGVHPTGGGRVTEIVARPLLNLYWPQLAGFVQPLAGEYAARRALLESVPFAGGYGVEIGLLIDVLAEVGLDGMGQVDLGVRAHAHQPDAALGRMAAEILQAASRRVPGWPEPAEPTLTTFVRDDQHFTPATVLVPSGERPPMRGVDRPD
jgi:glucosyl-3-phosphoglycerate synthase